MDVQKCFASIPHNLLKERLQAAIQDQRLLMLTIQIVDSFWCEETSSGRRGLPLGNVTSQLFSNVVLDALDAFVKHNLQEPHYFRYCDDWIVVNSRPSAKGSKLW